MRVCLLLVVAIFAIVTASCTADATTTTGADPTPSTSHALPQTVSVRGRTYDVECLPVAEALVDIELPHPAGQPRLRAITGLWDRQTVAVLANDAQGCGVWALGLAAAGVLSEEAAAAITDEVARGVEHFGVTASPVPKEP